MSSCSVQLGAASRRSGLHPPKSVLRRRHSHSGCVILLRHPRSSTRLLSCTVCQVATRGPSPVMSANSRPPRPRRRGDPPFGQHVAGVSESPAQGARRVEAWRSDHPRLSCHASDENGKPCEKRFKNQRRLRPNRQRLRGGQELQGSAGGGHHQQEEAEREGGSRQVRPKPCPQRGAAGTASHQTRPAKPNAQRVPGSTRSSSTARTP